MKKGIYIWGTGKIASVFYECIDDNHLDGFVDNNAEKRGLLFNNKRIYSFDEIKDWILYHHERVDGRGYYRLSADEIPLAARMIAITDTYSAITMQRAYKLPKTHEAAVAAMEEVAGTQLDRELLDIFLSIPKEELQNCIPQRVNYAESGTDRNPPFVPPHGSGTPS